MKQKSAKRNDISEIELLQSLESDKTDLSHLFGNEIIREGKASSFYDVSLKEVWGDPLECQN